MIAERPAFVVNGMQIEGREWEYLGHVEARPKNNKQKSANESCPILSNILDGTSNELRNDEPLKINLKKANQASQQSPGIPQANKSLSKSPNTSKPL